MIKLIDTHFADGRPFLRPRWMEAADNSGSPSPSSISKTQMTPLKLCFPSDYISCNNNSLLPFSNKLKKNSLAVLNVGP